MRTEGFVTIRQDYGVLNLHGFEFLFDIEDLSLINSRNWYKDKDGYLVSSYYYNGRQRFVRFHRIVMNAQQNQFVDHIFNDRADNRKRHLRLCTYAENDRNRGLYCTNKSGVSGVHYDAKRRKWVASITYNCRKIYLGRYTNKEDAVRARLIKEVELFKEFAPQKHLLEILGGDF